jgi:excisionase family DNA binding protein
MQRTVVTLVAFISFMSHNDWVRKGSFAHLGGHMTPSTLDPITIPPSQQEQVQELQKLMQREGKAFLVGNGGEPALELPDVVYSLLLRILQSMQQGNAISIVPFMQDLTTQDAANFLGVSRPFFVKLLEKGKLRHHMTGSHRRVYLKDLMEYRQHRDQEKMDAINRIAQFEEDAGLYDKVLLPDG